MPAEGLSLVWAALSVVARSVDNWFVLKTDLLLSVPLFCAAVVASGWTIILFQLLHPGRPIFTATTQHWQRVWCLQLMLFWMLCIITTGSARRTTSCLIAAPHHYCHYHSHCCLTAASATLITIVTAVSLPLVTHSSLLPLSLPLVPHSSLLPLSLLSYCSRYSVGVNAWSATSKNPGAVSGAAFYGAVCGAAFVVLEVVLPLLCFQSVPCSQALALECVQPQF